MGLFKIVTTRKKPEEKGHGGGEEKSPDVNQIKRMIEKRKGQVVQLRRRERYPKTRPVRERELQYTHRHRPKRRIF
jgi:hypothetical protein